MFPLVHASCPSRPWQFRRGGLTSWAELCSCGRRATEAIRLSLVHHVGFTASVCPFVPAHLVIHKVTPHPQQWTSVLRVTRHPPPAFFPDCPTASRCRPSRTQPPPSRLEELSLPVFTPFTHAFIHTRVGSVTFRHLYFQKCCGFILPPPIPACHFGLLYRWPLFIFVRTLSAL